MPSGRDIERAERNVRYKSTRRKESSSLSDISITHSVNNSSNRSYEIASVDQNVESLVADALCQSGLGLRKQHRHRHRIDSGGGDGGSSSSSRKKRKKKKRKLRDIRFSHQQLLSSSKKPLVEYSDVSSEDLPEPEAGEIQSEDSRGGNSYTDGEVSESLLRPRYYEVEDSLVSRGLNTSPISLSPPQSSSVHVALLSNKKSYHIPCSPPVEHLHRASSSEAAMVADNHHTSKSKLAGHPHSPDSSRHKSSSQHLSPSPNHVGSSRRRHHHSPSSPVASSSSSRRRDHSTSRRRDYSPTNHRLIGGKHSPSPRSSRRDFSPSPSSHRRSRADDLLLSRSPSSSSRKRRRDDSARRHRHHKKDRRDKRKSIRSPVGSSSSRLQHLSRSRSPRSPHRNWRKSRSRSRRRSRSPKKSRSPVKTHKSSRKHRSKSPRLSRIPSPVHRTTRKSPNSILERTIKTQNKISETTLFAELVKNRNMQELAYKKLKAAKEKASQDDVQIIEGLDEKDNSNGSSSSTTLERGGNNDKSSTDGATPVTNVDLTVDVVDIPVPQPSSLQSTLPTTSVRNFSFFFLSLNLIINHINS